MKKNFFSNQISCTYASIFNNYQLHTVLIIRVTELYFRSIRKYDFQIKKVFPFIYKYTFIFTNYISNHNSVVFYNLYVCILRSTAFHIL